MDVSLLVEGSLDEAVGSVLLQHAALATGTVYGKKGWAYIRDNIQGFNNAAHFTPTLALVDFGDTAEECPPSLVENWIAGQLDTMVLRAAVPEIESWLLADQAGFAEFLGIRRHLVPNSPDDLADAKSEVMRLASGSRYRHRRQAIVPKHGYSAREGPLYNSEMVGFVRERWDIDAAATHSPSLRSAVQRIEELAKRIL